MPASDDATAGPARDAVHAAWRADSARLVGALTRMTRDVELAADLAQDALVAALEQWPVTGVPDNPSAWLMTTAKRRGIDHFRREDNLRRKTTELEAAGRDRGEEADVPDLESQVDHIEDDVLRLVFLSCHPSLTADSRVALTLRLVGGLTTAEIARALLTSESTVGQRISRAKKTLATAGASFDLPTGQERVERLDDVMAVVYLIFNEGYTATAGDDWMRPDLAAEAIRLARMLASLAPDEPEVLGLHALLELQGSRVRARLSPTGEPVLLEDQDRSRWDELMIRRGLAALARASTLAASGTPVGRYFLQASIAAEHARPASAPRPTGHASPGCTTSSRRRPPARSSRSTEPSPTAGRTAPRAGLAVLDGTDLSALGDSPLVPSVRGDLLERAGSDADAASAFELGATLTRNEGERALLERRAERCRSRT